MANNNRCGGRGRRDSNNGYGCLGCVGGRGRWDNYPYYGGPCPDADGSYEREDADYREDDDNRRRRRRCRGPRYGIFTGMLPMAVAANGVVPLVGGCLCGESFPVNSGLITLEDSGAYLATYTVRVPEGSTLETTLTLNVNDASQSTAITEVGGAGPAGFTAQAIFEVHDRATVALRSSEAINLAGPSAQPLITLSLVKLEEE